MKFIKQRFISYVLVCGAALCAGGGASARDIVYFGSPHNPIGQAKIPKQPGGDSPLFLTGFGSSGMDGFEIGLRGAEYFQMFFEPLNAAQLPQTARLRAAAELAGGGGWIMEIAVVPGEQSFQLKADLTHAIDQIVIAQLCDTSGAVLDSRAYVNVPQVFARFRPETCEFTFNRWDEDAIYQIVTFPTQTSASLIDRPTFPNVHCIKLIVQDPRRELLDRAVFMLTDIPQLTIFDEWVGKFGNRHRSLGDTAFDFTQGLLVRPSGPADGAGVRIDSPDQSIVGAGVGIAMPLDGILGQQDDVFQVTGLYRCRDLRVETGLTFSDSGNVVAPGVNISSSASTGDVTIRCGPYTIGSFAFHSGLIASAERAPDRVFATTLLHTPVWVVHWSAPVRLNFPEIGPFECGSSETTLVISRRDQRCFRWGLDSIDLSNLGSGDFRILSENVELVCPADWDDDRLVGSQDFFSFLTDFFNNDADMNNDGLTDSQDFFGFLTSFFDGCA